jgi:asparagine synthetase B (glutamine-hydrolysing)
MEVRKTLTKIIDEYDSDAYYILLSGGLDSQSLLFSALELGKTVIVVSFTRDDYDSRDFIAARSIAEKLQLEFIPVYLPTTLDDVKRYTLMLSKTYNCTSKTEFECTYPMYFAYNAIRDHAVGHKPVILSGAGADFYYVLSKNGVINFKDDPDTFRAEKFSKANACQQMQHAILQEDTGVRLLAPYRNMEIFNLFKGSTWDECNLPMQKNHVRTQYKDDLIAGHYYPHRAYQVGKNGISDMFKQLVDSDWNIKNWKTATGIFNAVNKGDISE